MPIHTDEVMPLGSHDEVRAAFEVVESLHLDGGLDGFWAGRATAVVAVEDDS